MKVEIFESIRANVMMYNVKINSTKTIYDLKGRYVKQNKKYDIVRFYLEFGKEETMKMYYLTSRAFYKIIDGIGYVSTYNVSDSKYDFMQSEQEMFGFKCTFDDLSESEKKIYNKLL